MRRPALAAPPRRADGIAPLKQVHRAACYDYRLVEQRLGGASKRAIDILLSVAALLLLSPIMALIALIIRLESPGPALFKQRRTGFRGRSFYIQKFRSMRTMESGRRVSQAIEGDPRVTPFGAFLRRSSLDELPQLINVLKGEMSIVGPRPHALNHDADFYAITGAYPRRFLARPGITGLAQVSGARGATDTPDKVRARVTLDLHYIDNWSLFRDIAIIARTCLVVVSGRNAF
jgi:putative colanic acid biosynthesis UDP-glucose lipid carrier transferase